MAPSLPCRVNAPDKVRLLVPPMISVWLLVPEGYWMRLAMVRGAAEGKDLAAARGVGQFWSQQQRAGAKRAGGDIAYRAAAEANGPGRRNGAAGIGVGAIQNGGAIATLNQPAEAGNNAVVNLAARTVVGRDHRAIISGATGRGIAGGIDGQIGIIGGGGNRTAGFGWWC